MTQVRVYTYGVHYSAARHLPEGVMNQLYLAEMLRNKLVEAWIEYEDSVAEVWASYPEIAIYKDEIDKLLQESKDLKGELKKENSRARTNKPNTEKAKELREQIKVVSVKLKELRPLYKEARDFAYEDGVNERMMEIGLIRHNKEKATYKEFCQDQGLYHGTHYDVLQSHKTAIKNLREARKKAKENPDMPWPQLRTKRFDGTGVLAVGLKKGNRNTRTPEECGLAKGPHRNTLSIPVTVTEEEWNDMTDGERRRAGRVIARYRYAAGNREEDTIIELPIQMNRPIPANAIIKQGKLVVTKKGTETKATLNVIVELPDPEPVPVVDLVKVAFRYKKTNNEVEVLRFDADAPFLLYADIKADDRYSHLSKSLRVSSDLKSGSLVLPSHYLNSLDKWEEMQSQSDLAFDKARDMLAEYIALNGEIEEPGRFDKEGNPFTLRAIDVSRWKSHGRLAVLVIRLRENRTNDKALNDLIDELESWRKLDKKMANSIAGYKKRTALRRDDLYAQFATLLTDNYSKIELGEGVDQQKGIKDVGNNNDLPEEVKRIIRKQRALASPGGLRARIEATAKREGVTLTSSPGFSRGEDVKRSTPGYHGSSCG